MQRIGAPLGVLVAAAAVLAMVANASFLGVAAQPVAWAAAAAALVAAGLFGRVAVRLRDCAPAALVLVLPAIHFYWPLWNTQHDLLLADAGDFNQYLSLGGWFTGHAATRAADLGAGLNMIQQNLHDHQAHFLRLGSTFLLAFVAALSGRPAAEVYTPFTAVAVGLQALGMYVFLLAAFARLPRWACALAAMLFAVAPAVTWPAYAAFLPQTLGLAFLLAAVGIFVQVQNAAAAEDRAARAARCIALAFCLFALLSIYPESLPLGLTVSGLLVLGRLALGGRGARLALPVLAAAGAIALSPHTFAWAVRGFLAQLDTLAHGGPQQASPYNLLATALAATQLPLVPPVLDATSPALRLAAAGLMAIVLLGFLWACIRGPRQIAVAVALAIALLFIAVALKYHGPRFTAYAHWETLYRWNLFKSAQYAAPFAVAIGLGGFLLFASSLHRGAGLACVLLLAGLSLTVARGQDRQVWPRAYLAHLNPDSLRLLQSMPADGALLVSADGLPQPYRFLIYSRLMDRPFLNTRDGRSEVMLAPGVERRTLNGPIAYVLADSQAAAMAHLPVLARGGELRLLDARGAAFSVVLQHKIGPDLRLDASGTGATVSRLPAAR